MIAWNYANIMQTPIYDAAPTPSMYVILMLVAIIATGLTLVIKRPKAGSKQNLALFIILALIIGSGLGWYGRVFFEHYAYTHQPPYVDCPTC